MSRCEFAHGDLLVLHLHLVDSAQFSYLEKLDDFSGGKGSDLLPALGNGVFFFEAQGFFSWEREERSKTKANFLLPKNQRESIPPGYWPNGFSFWNRSLPTRPFTGGKTGALAFRSGRFRPSRKSSARVRADVAPTVLGDGLPVRGNDDQGGDSADSEFSFKCVAFA